LKTSRWKHAYRSNASKLHIAVGELLRNSKFFSGYEIYQEYPVNYIWEDFHSGKEKFDWVIQGLKVVIECHGEQHYKPVDFSGKLSEDQVVSNFKDIQFRDKLKADAAAKAGYTYIEISYKDEPTEVWLLEQIATNFSPLPAVSKPEPSQEEKDKRKARLNKAKEYRKVRYNKLKGQKKK
jgi:hypothetical protein